MALPVIADTFRIALNWSYAGQSACNVLHIRDELGTQDEGQAMFALDEALQTNQWQSTVEEAMIDSVDILKLDGVSATQVFVPPVEDRYHGQTGLDAVIAAGTIVSLRTGQRGARGRGRVYLPFTGEPAINDGSLDATVQGSMQAEWVDFRNQLGDNNFQLVVASYTHADAHAVSNVIVEERLATQRRRQDRLRRG